jgi:hypothetical protein
MVNAVESHRRLPKFWDTLGEIQNVNYGIE